MDPDKELIVYNSVCSQVSSRGKYLSNFVGRYDMVFFVSGKESSNGKALYQACREINENTHFISKPEDSDEFSIEGIENIGICGATSTPGWLLNAVKERLLER